MDSCSKAFIKGFNLCFYVQFIGSRSLKGTSNNFTHSTMFTGFLEYCCICENAVIVVCVK